MRGGLSIAAATVLAAGERPERGRHGLGLGDDGFIKDLELHVLVGDRVVSTALHNYRYPKPLTQEQIQQKAEQAARLAIGRLQTT